MLCLGYLLIFIYVALLFKGQGIFRAILQLTEHFASYYNLLAMSNPSKDDLVKNILATQKKLDQQIAQFKAQQKEEEHKSSMILQRKPVWAP